jgi:phage tail-like protein
MRPFAHLRTADQWARCAHRATRLAPAGNGVELAWLPVQPGDAPTPAPALAGGLAFDAECRLYRSDPERGEVERSLWAPADALGHTGRTTPVSDLFGVAPGEVLGDFSAPGAATALQQPRGLAVDVDDRLFVAESGALRILAFDLWSRRLLRRVPTAPQVPLGLACAGRVVWAVLADPPGLVRLRARTAPEPVALPPAPAPGVAPERIALSAAGEPHLLHRGAGAAWVVPLDRPDHALEVDGATDLAFDGEDALVVARRPGESFLRFRRELDGWVVEAPLAARGYDGLGVARDPDGRIVFWTPRGVRRAIGARIRYVATGRVTTYQLDSGAFQTEWGRLFLDACVPEGTAVGAHFATSDDDEPDEPALPRDPPQNVVDVTVIRPDLSPPLVPLSRVPADTDPGNPLHRRETGRELPWTRHAADDPFETYEAPVNAPAGRFLWVTLELRGDTRATPRVRSLRAEHPTHDLVRRLPRTFSREEVVASFLRRYLAILDGTLDDLDGRGAARRALLDPESAPAELLDWLAGFLGLALDERWPAATRRRLIAEGAWLMRFRGTVAGLARFIELYVGVPPILVEHWRLRGLGGDVGGDPLVGAVVGATFRVGGAVGLPGEAPLEGNVQDAFAARAHRFSVVIPAALGPEQLDVVRHVLEVHRPAHTIVDVCSAGAGMRVGRGLHVGLMSMIGRTGGFTTLQLGAGSLGRGSIIGRPVPGTTPEASRLGENARVG